MKLLNSISFYILLALSMIMILNNEFNRYNIIGLVILGILFMIIKNYTKNKFYELLGITYLQKKFKNSDIIMDMTNE